MIRPLILLVFAVLAAPVFADEMHGELHHRDPFALEIQSILREYEDRSPASLTFGEMEELAARLSVPAQKAAFVRKSAIMSYMMPGAGQFRNGDALSGALFLGADLAVAAGTAIGLYFLLPPELRFDELDYFNKPYRDIEAAWETAKETATAAEALPFWGVATGGMLLKHLLSHFSARHAAGLARENISNGTTKFTPHAGFFMGHHGPGIGFGMGY